MSGDAGLTCINTLFRSRMHLPNIHPRSTQAQVNSPALSDQQKAFKLALRNLFPSRSVTLSVPLATLSPSLSLWQYTDVLRAAHPSCVAWRKCIDLSAKWYVVLLFPRDSDVLSLLRRSLCLAQLQREI